MRVLLILLAIAMSFATSAFTPPTVSPPSVTSQPPTKEELAGNPRLFLRLAGHTLKWKIPAEPCKIVGPIHFVGTAGLSSFLITTTQGHILIHTGMPSSGPMIEESIRKLGFDPADIRFILVGHAHIDHVGGHAHLKKLSGARVAVMDREADLYQSGGKLDFHYGSEADFLFQPTAVDRVLRDGEVIKLGDVAITTLLTPGHTHGSTTFVTNVIDEGQTYTVVFPNGTSINPGYRLVRNPSYPGIADDFRRTFHALEMLRPDIWLDGHTDVFDFQAKRARAADEGVQAWVDPEGYRRWVVNCRDKFEAAINAELAASGPKPNPAGNEK